MRAIPPFSDLIRTYKGDLSDLKQMTAYSYEDSLQVCLCVLGVVISEYLFVGQTSCPVFDGLLDEPHDLIVRELVYSTAMVHSLSKLRIHTASTAESLCDEIKRFGAAIRQFKDVTCVAFQTSELPAESGKRLRRAGHRAAGNGQDGPGSVQTSMGKTFNANTSKLHALGDYVQHIVMYGTTDSYSTAIVSALDVSPFASPGFLTRFVLQGETEHKKSRQNYLRTNRVNYVSQVAEIERVQSNLAYLAELRNEVRIETAPQPIDDDRRDMKVHYKFGARGAMLDLRVWMSKNIFDPALKVSVSFRGRLHLNQDCRTLTVCSSTIFTHDCVTLRATMTNRSFPRFRGEMSTSRICGYMNTKG